MRAHTIGRSGIAQAAVVSLVTLAALTLLGLVLAYWTWQWLAPLPESRAPAVVGQDVRLSAAYGLFGNAPRDTKAAAPSSTSAIRLLGVVAAVDGHNGYAVMQLESRDILAVREGEDVAPGIQLAEVHPDHVVLSRNGARESLAWPQSN